MFRKLLMFAALLPVAASAQTVATFESLTLPSVDTYYVNYTMPGKDVGFINGLAHFPTVYDTSGPYTFLSYGFVYTNKADSVTSGYLNQYSAKAGRGYDSSSKYVVAYGETNKVQLLGGALGHSVRGFYITNSTYAYNAIRDGGFPSRKFGDTTGTHSGLPQGTYPDYFKLTVKGYKNNALKADSVEFFLADYRFNNSANDYVVRDWRWVDLSSLGVVDSLLFTLSSSDVGQFGINTPLYFCMDNFITNESGLGVHAASAYAAKVYPMPAGDVLHVEDASGELREATIVDAGGRILYSVQTMASHIELPLQSLASGIYFLRLQATGGRTSTVRFVKQ